MTHADDLIHRPIRKPRPGHTGEAVYASMWKVAMSEDWQEEDDRGDKVPPLEILLDNIGRRVQQRDATVAATVICWLGCNMGLSIVREGEAAMLRGECDKRDRYLLAWTKLNVRKHYVNHGVRTIEYMLAPEDHYNTEPRHFLGGSLKKRPELSADDLEVADRVMLWLATDRGQRFLRQCEREIDRLRDEENRRKLAEQQRHHV